MTPRVSGSISESNCEDVVVHDFDPFYLSLCLDPVQEVKPILESFFCDLQASIKPNILDQNLFDFLHAPDDCRCIGFV